MAGSSKTYDWSKKKTQELLKLDFIRFGIVGSIGFVVSEGFLFILSGKLGLIHFWALLLSNEAGLISNFIFHETWTYKHADHHHKSVWKKFGHFHLSSWSGIAIIVGIGLLGTKVFGINIYLSQAIGSAVAMFWNFFWTKYFIFKGSTPKALLDPEDTILE